MVLCVVVGCSSKSGNRKGLGVFCIRKIITNQGEDQEEEEKRIDLCGESRRHYKQESASKRVNKVVANTSL